MKAVIVAVIVAVIMIVMLQFKFGSGETVTILREDTVEVQPIEVKDVITEAQKELDRINNELDTEEAKLLEERKAIDARLEKLRETRVSFQ